MLPLGSWLNVVRAQVGEQIFGLLLQQPFAYSNFNLFFYHYVCDYKRGQKILLQPIYL